MARYICSVTADVEAGLFAMSDCKGLLILDSGATVTMGGVNLLEDVQMFFVKSCQYSLPVHQATPMVITFANSTRDKCVTVTDVPYPQLGIYFRIRVLSADGPLLAGEDLHINLGLVVDHTIPRVYSKKLKCEIPVIRLASKHLAIGLCSEETVRLMKSAPE